MTSHKVGALTPYNEVGLYPVDHRFEENRWESFEADVLVGIVWAAPHQVVWAAWVNLNSVIPASRLI